MLYVQFRVLYLELFSSNACDCELVNCELIGFVFEHELTMNYSKHTTPMAILLNPSIYLG